MFSIFLHPLAHRELESLDRTVQEAVRRKLKELEREPRRGKPLTHSRFWSLRIGDYRAIYEIAQQDRVIVLFIGHRKHVYGDLSRAFRGW